VAGVIGAEINFELRLPDDWNGKFVFGGGGGFVGSVMNAAHDVEDVVADGWATVGTDTGHRGNALDARWALNNLERLVNFGHLAVHRTTVNAKALTEAFYGRPISRSIFFGCSRGGGQALMEAQRYPQDYDGIVAMSPAYDWTYEMGAKWTQVARAMYPDPANISEPVLNADALKVLGDAVMARCDGLDGLEDGILNDPRQCDFDVRDLACGTAPANACLSPDQVAAAEAIYGDLDIAGRVVRGRPVGGELPGYPFGWDLWLTGGYDPDEEEVEFHEGADSEEFPAPKVANATWGFAMGVMGSFLYNDPDWTYAGYDFSDFPEKAARVATTLNADNPDLSAFRARGGKLIIDNGWMDASLSPYHTIAYYEQVLELDPSARNDVRLFLRPGVTHCRLGPGPDGTDYLAAMDAWLDTGEAPEQLPAVFRDIAGQPTGGGRIVCAYPNVVTYRGEGDPRDPASFSCELPK
jgi:feruloyl esterase